MLDYNDFVSQQKSMLIAPAGYGKTHTIAECLKYTKGKQLILTHTHAGVAAIKEKISKANIPSSNYNVETITGFAQKYVLAFYTGTDIPKQEDSNQYYPFIIEKSTKLFKLKPISNIILNSYTGLFIDEYQDCTIQQHALILALSDLLPTHILGDHLQGIFEFNGESPLVNLKNPSNMGEFTTHLKELTEPWRWKNGNNEKLGSDLKNIRKKLLDQEEIDFEAHTSIEFKKTDNHRSIDEFLLDNKVKTTIRNLVREESLLIIHPESGNATPRKKFIQHFGNNFFLIEAIDGKDFYHLSNEIDKITNSNVVISIKSISLKLFNKGGIDNWFNDTGLKRKIKEEDKLLIQPVKENLEQLELKISYSLIADTLKKIKNLPDIKNYRVDLFNSLCKALDEAEYNNITVYNAMIQRRNLIRRIGRKVYGKCVGTTLLTKGLEFDTVVILEAHKFNCPKNLYVALTRASKRLIVFTNNTKLRPYT